MYAYDTLRVPVRIERFLTVLAEHLNKKPSTAQSRDLSVVER